MGFTPELLWGIGIVALLAALAWGVRQYNHRNPANEPLTEAATREMYQHPESYDETRERLKKQVKPS